MSKKACHAPSYRLHKPSGHARVIIDGKHIYLGKYGTPESQEKHYRLVAEWLASGKHSPSLASATATASAATINELILAFWQHAKQRYVKNGEPTSELRSFKTALRPVRQLYGHELVNSFGPLAFVACRQKLVEADYCRRRINQHVTRIRHVFKWGVARELVPETVWLFTGSRRPSTEPARIWRENEEERRQGSDGTRSRSWSDDSPPVELTTPKPRPDTRIGTHFAVLKSVGRDPSQVVTKEAL